MSEVQFYKVNDLPGTLVPDSFYFIPHDTENWAESYLTDSAGVAKSIGNSEMITQIVSEQVGPGKLTIVEHIAARNALDLDEEDHARLVLVVDATDDEDVESGGALYAWKPDAGTNGEWRLIVAYADLTYDFSEIDISWSQLVDGPTSTPTEIDEAVNESHEHANFDVLEFLGEDAEENLTYRGNPVAAVIEWSTTDW